MNYLDKFLIPFKGLKNGEHSYKFEVDHSFFEAFNNQSDINGQFTIELLLLKEIRMMILNFDIKGDLDTECHLCLEPFKLHINEQKKLIVKFGEENRTDNDEIIVIAETTDELNVAQAIYDYINLTIPLRRVHPSKENGEPGCNIKTLKKIKEYLHHEQASDDSRWQELKKLKFD